MTSLKRALNAYHTDKVEIKRIDQKESRAIVETIKKDVYHFLREINVPVRPFEAIGSVFEGLKVITYDEFDLLMPIKITNHVKVIPIRKAGQCYLSLKRHTNRYIRGSSGSRNEWSKDLSRYTDDKGYLSATLVRRAFQSFLQRWVSVFQSKHQPTPYIISVSTGGPAITVQLQKGGPKLSIDFVPALDLTDTDSLHIAKPRKQGDLESDIGSDNGEESLWMISHCRLEKVTLKNIDRHDNGCRKKCIKILKTIRQHREQLRGLSNYAFKMIILKLNNERSWLSKDLADCFVDSIKELHRSLEIQNLPSYFNKSVNIFASMSPIAMANMEGYLKRIIRKRTYIDDLLTCPERCKMCYTLSLPQQTQHQEIIDWRFDRRQ
ncbi:unnamed protein product [Owenia fusiformis]|uniref:Uncharacterized protein n=1 Tax=Owenia fusiformis TaxID=6347 RepID=A0A8S4N2K3_OWEFU|nr:unnamed protein product [Owenia fusiformis]